VYGTVIGSHGNRNSSLNEDLNWHLSDFEKIYQQGAICISGDFNTSFCDSYYNSQYSRNKLNAAFDKLELINLTSGIPGSIDHIVVSKFFMENKMYDMDIWNQDKKLSDHIGVLVTIL
jgi:endonuclease/exonuclease/phosphatase family metal-dependent hydrolase